MKSLLIYNLYPKLFGTMDKWELELSRIKKMGFEYVYLNPVSLNGKSNSDYSIKDHFSFNPDYVFEDTNYNEETLKSEGRKKFKHFCKVAKENDLKVMLDIVINHTAIDSDLINTNPKWYTRTKNGDIFVPGVYDKEEWIEWSDLADIDNSNSKDKVNLWKYWEDMINYYIDLGVDGFRCDAAFMVPSELWKHLISKTKRVKPEILFIGETLGCKVEELLETANSGFDLIMNSFKWWNLQEEWFIEEYNKYSNFVSSLSFPENHDTRRYAEEVEGNISKMIQKYFLSAIWSKGTAITSGFEYGFRKRINVFTTNKESFETTSINIENDILKINNIKKQFVLFNEDCLVTSVKSRNKAITAYLKESDLTNESALIIINNSEELVSVSFSKLNKLISKRYLVIRLNSQKITKKNTNIIELKPYEVVILHSLKGDS